MQSEPGQAVRLVWQESGGPRIEAPIERAFGLSLIERSVSYELDGRCELEFPPEGVRCELIIPYTPDNFQIE